MEQYIDRLPIAVRPDHIVSGIFFDHVSEHNIYKNHVVPNHFVQLYRRIWPSLHSNICVPREQYIVMKYTRALNTN